MKKYCLLGDKGFSLLEVMIFMPVYLVVLGGLIGAYSFVCKNYVGLSCQWECISEMRNISAQLATAIDCAHSISIIGDSSIVISHYSNDGVELKDRYTFVKRPEGGLLYLNGQPLSALDQQHHVRLQELSFKEILPYKVMVHIVVENGVTGRSIALDIGMFSHCLWRKIDNNQHEE